MVASATGSFVKRVLACPSTIYDEYFSPGLRTTPLERRDGISYITSNEK